MTTKHTSPPALSAHRKRGRPLLTEREKTMRDLATALGMKPERFALALRRGTLHPYAAVAAARALGLTTRETAFGTGYSGAGRIQRGGQPRKVAGVGATAPATSTELK